MKQKRQVVILVGLVAIAGIVWYFERLQPTTAANPVAVAQNYQLLAIENPQLHHDGVERARNTEYKSSGRNIFSTVALPIPVPIAPAVIESAGPPKPIVEPPPPPPTLPVKFFGYGTVPNGTTRHAFFTNGEDVYIVGEGEVLLNRFRILKVGNASLEFEEISSGRRNTAPLEEQSPSPSA